MRTPALVITGANGNLGRRLLVALAAGQSEKMQPIRALVRSERAAQRLAELPAAARPETQVVDYLDPDAMAVALAGARAVVHLVGIVKESRTGSYAQAHEQTCAVLAQAAAVGGVQRVVYLSILGADPNSANSCLASKGAAETLLLESGVPTRVLRVPMVLGEGDYASAALAKRARRRVSWVFRGSSMEQPIYAGDLIAAVVSTLEASTVTSSALDLAGPESLTREALTRRSARALGRVTRVISLPLVVGVALAWLLERLMSAPPVTAAMLGVLNHDDVIDPEPAIRTLGLRLTSLEDMLATCLTDTEGAGDTT